MENFDAKAEATKISKLAKTAIDDYGIGDRNKAAVDSQALAKEVASAWSDKINAAAVHKELREISTSIFTVLPDVCIEDMNDQGNIGQTSSLKFSGSGFDINFSGTTPQWVGMSVQTSLSDTKIRFHESIMNPPPDYTLTFPPVSKAPKS